MKKISMFIVLAACLLLAPSALATKKIFVGNLPWATTAIQVERLAAPFGEVLGVAVRMHDDGEFRNASAEVLFRDPEDADEAARALDGFVIGRHTIRSKPKEIVVVGSKVKDVVRSAGVRLTPDTFQRLNDKVHRLLQTAITRAKANGRQTVRPYDL